MAHRPSRRGTGRAAYPSALLTNSPARYWTSLQKHLRGRRRGWDELLARYGQHRRQLQRACFGSRMTTNFSSITDPPVLDGSTGKEISLAVESAAKSKGGNRHRRDRWSLRCFYAPLC